MIRAFAILAAALLFVASSSAHEVRPAYLEARENGDGQFEVVWKQPVADGRRLALKPRFPGSCEESGDRRMAFSGGAVSETWNVTGCDFRSGTLRVDGLDRTLTDVFVRVAYADGGVASGLLKPSAPAMPLDAESGWGLPAYFSLGVEHIIFGFDHLLFVAGLVLLVERRSVLGAVTSFTVAHSFTLGLATLNAVRPPQAPVELLIAASIVFLAVEVVRRRRGRTSLFGRRPWIIAFVIGLLHGCGFAGALEEIGLPRGQELAALALFNLGVEAGQIAFIAALMLAIWMLGRASTQARTGFETALAYGVGICGAFWVFERAIG